MHGEATVNLLGSDYPSVLNVTDPARVRGSREGVSLLSDALSRGRRRSVQRFLPVQEGPMA